MKGTVTEIPTVHSYLAFSLAGHTRLQPLIPSELDVATSLVLANRWAVWICVNWHCS